MTVRILCIQLYSHVYFEKPTTNLLYSFGCLFLGKIWRAISQGYIYNNSIQTGLSPLLADVHGANQEYLQITEGSEKNYFKLHLNLRSLSFISVSVGPTGIWALYKRNVQNEIRALFINNNDARNGISQEIDQSKSFASVSNISMIDVGPTNIVYAINGTHICSRVGINDTNPQGTSWKCSERKTELLSCGINGCYFVNRQNITFRPENETTMTVEFTTPNRCGIIDIDAGLNYELWVVTSSNDVYRRTGTSAYSPIGFSWELVPGIQLSTISIGIFGPVGILTGCLVGGCGRAFILNGKNWGEWFANL